MFHKVLEDFEEPKVIWNKKTRQELKEVLEEELTIMGKEPWDFDNFSVIYHSPKDFFVIPYYLNLLEAHMKKSKDYKIEEPLLFVRNLYDALVVEESDDKIELILRTMKNVINKHIELFQKFEYMPYLVFYFF
jgi:hypothetical protein